jgi:hypothetical protein
MNKKIQKSKIKMQNDNSKCKILRIESCPQKTNADGFYEHSKKHPQRKNCQIGIPITDSLSHNPLN